MKPSHLLIGFGALFAVVALWRFAPAGLESPPPSLSRDIQRYTVTSSGSETVLLDTGTGETWRLAGDDSDSNELYWSRLPAPGGIATHPWGASPFTEVRFNGDTVNDGINVEFRSQQYELISVDGFSTRTLLEQARHHFGSQPHQWQKGFAEDLPSLMKRMENPAGDFVSLVLKDATTNTLITIERAPMTKDNRQEVWHRRNQPSPG